MNVLTNRHTMSNLSFGYPNSASKTNKYQPVRIPITHQNSDSKNPASNRKRNGLSMCKPVRILQTPIETKKPPVRKRLDMMYETGKSIGNRNSTIMKCSTTDLRDPYNKKSVILHETNGSSTLADNRPRRSRLIQPGTIKNNFIRKSSIMVQRKEGASITNFTAASQNKSIRHSDIPEESSPVLDSSNEIFDKETKSQEQMNVLNQERIQIMVKGAPVSNDIDNKNGTALPNLGIYTKEHNSDEINPANRAESERPSVIVTLKPKSLVKSKLDCCNEMLGNSEKGGQNGCADKPSQMSESINSNEVKCQISVDIETLVALELNLKNCIQTQEMHLQGLRNAMATLQVLLNANEQSNTDFKIETTKYTGLNEALTLTSINPPNTNSPNHLQQANRSENIMLSPELQRLPDDFENDLPDHPDISEQANKSAVQQNEFIEKCSADEPDSLVSQSISKEVLAKENRRNILAVITLNSQPLEESNENQPPVRRRSARLANKQLTASPSPKNGLTNNNKPSTSKSKPCTPRARTPRHGKGTVRTETPLREYMLLKSVNKFLVTPDTRSYQSSLDENLVDKNNDSGNTNFDRTFLSQKLLKSLQKLYVATP